MRVALDLSPLHRGFTTSVRRTVGPILERLEARGGVTVIDVRPPEGGSLGLWRQRVLPREARERGAQLIHCFGSSFPLRARLPVVHTVHEAPWAHGVRENGGWRHRFWAAAGRRRAARTCTPSPGIARDLARSGAAWPGLRVVPWGVGPEFCPDPDGTDDELARGVRPLPEGPFVLAMDGFRRKKRLDLVLEGAAAAGLPVVVTGLPAGPGRESPGADLPDVPAGPGGALPVGQVPGALVPALVHRAAALAVLSDSEGFSLPVLEALASGTPVVVPRGSVQAETAGGAALTVDRDDPAAVGAAFRAALARDPARRAAGLVRAAGLSWDRTVERLVEVWGELL